MSRFAKIAVVLALTAIAAPAMAERPARPEAGEKAHKKPSFPLAAAEFRAHAEKGLAKAKERFEERVKEMPAEQGKEARAKFDVNYKKAKELIDQVTADGTVTADEAKSVWEVTKTLRGGKGHGHHGEHGGRPSPPNPKRLALC